MRSFFKLSAIAVLGVICGIGVVFGYKTVAADFGTATATISSTGAQAPDASAAFADSVSDPAYLIIPTINVDAPVTDVGLAASGDGDLGVPSDAIHVAWYKEGPKPGDEGAAVIDGHLDTVNTPEAVFYNLDKLAPGDDIEVVTTSGQTLTFMVTGTASVPYTAATTGIFNTSSSVPQLNLITCAGDWVPSIKLYNERFVVYSQLVSSSTTSASS
jgi:LPXTG-site transpeptidase (sortase) family protein